jgi:5-methyltetrahydrofolate--homocysteine methyltransferase
MAELSLTDRVKEGVLFLDGAMGTQLMSAGVEVGSCYDYQNVVSPETVGGVHARYFGAGCEAVVTNTLGATSYALSRHGHGDKVAEINLAGAQLARKAAGDGGYVLGDIGPCGDFIEPLGTVKREELQAAFADQVRALSQGDVDGVIIETMTAIEEVVIAVNAVHSVCDLPVFACMSFDAAGDGFRTMMGVSPADMISQLGPLGIAGIGYNCGTLSMEGYVRLTKVFADALEETDAVLIAEPNAGKPELVDGGTAYNLSGEEFAEAMLQIRDAGAKVMGGCCGTSPAHIGEMIKRLR